MFFLDCPILHFSGCHFLDTLRPFQRIKHSIFSGLLWKGWGHELKSNFRNFSGWKHSMTLWMKYSAIHCKLENWNQEEKFYGEILKNSNLPTNLNFLVYKYKGMKYSNFKCNKHVRLNKLYVNSEKKKLKQNT